MHSKDAPLINYFMFVAVLLEVYNSLYTSQVAHQVGAYLGFCLMRRPGIFLLPLEGMLVYHRGYPQH